jgi:hypothetical protein
MKVKSIGMKFAKKEEDWNGKIFAWNKKSGIHDLGVIYL